MNKRLQYLEDLADQQDQKAYDHYVKCKICLKNNGKRCKIYTRLISLLRKTEDLITKIELSKKPKR